MPVQLTLNKGKVPVKIYTRDVDSKSLNQLGDISQLPFIHHHVAAMPDVHVGKGATVGSVIPTRSAIIPAAIGVDIGCGMNAVRLSLKASDLPEKLRKIRSAIEAKIPVSFNQHKYYGVKASTIKAMDRPIERILYKHPGIRKMVKYFDRTWGKQLATLGGGNHFIEICLDENQDVWVMLHSGSRAVGNAIGRYFISKAKKDMGNLLGRLPNKDLAYFQEGTQHFDDYMDAVDWAQNYAMVNRREMMRKVVEVLQQQLPKKFSMTKEAINCHHNYVQKETHYGAEVYVTRKGAIRAGLGELGIIPGSMGTKSYIVRGKGNKVSFCSCAHGAGRKMSRSHAKRYFNRFDLAEMTQGIECRKDKGVVDEIPAAYKNIDKVMKDQHDLVEIIHTLKQVVCIKG